MEWVSGNIFIRPMMECVKAGTRVEGHRHKFDHTTVVFTGGVHVKAKTPSGLTIERDFHAPAHFLVRADLEHEITAIEDDTTARCFYSHRTPQGDVVQVYDGWTPAYDYADG